MLNVDSTLHISMKNLRMYEKLAIEAERVLDLQFNPAVIERIKASVSGHHKPTPKKRQRLSIRLEEDPKRAIAWAVAQRVREAREKQGLRQEDIATMTGIARPNIVRIEQGRHVPSLTTLRKIADALRLDINTLTAKPEVAVEDIREFSEMAESGIAEWEKDLEVEDRRR